MSTRCSRTCWRPPGRPVGQDGPVKRRRSVEVESLDAFDRRVAAGATSMRGWRVQDVDLTGRSDVLARLDARGALVLGGRLAPGAEEDLRARGALVFPALPDAPVDV